MIGSALAPRLIKKFHGNERKALLASEISIGILITIMGQFGNYGLAIALFLLHELPRGMVVPIKDAYLNNNIESKERATILSFESIAHHFGGAIGLLLSGLLARSAGIPLTWLVFGSFLVIGTTLVAKNGRH
jgi:sugar phosphate permease